MLASNWTDTEEAVFSISLYAGGGPAVFWAPLLACTASMVITLGVAEHASAFPTTGGQYHFAFMVSPPNFRAPIAFFTGWLSLFAWLFSLAAVNILIAQICVALAQLHNPEYIATQWQVYLIYVGITLLDVAIVAYLPRLVPLTESVFFWASVIGMLASFITVLAVSSKKQSAEVVFRRWINQTGWNDGIAFFVAVGQNGFCFSCTDTACHLAEELPNPTRKIPRIMWITLVIGFFTAVPFALALAFVAPDYESIMTSSLPILTLYSQILKSEAGATFLTFILLFVYVGCGLGMAITSGRLIWAFSRDNGFPFSGIFSQTHPTLKTPVNATIAAGAFCILYGLIYIGSTTAFNSFIATGVLGLEITYTIPQVTALLCGRDKVLPERAFDLGNTVGTFVNIFSLCWTSFYVVIYSFPIFLPVTKTSMSYVSVVMVGTCLFIAAMWFLGGKRKVFVGPNVQFKGRQATRSSSEMVDNLGDSASSLA